MEFQGSSVTVVSSSSSEIYRTFIKSLIDVGYQVQQLSPATWRYDVSDVPPVIIFFCDTDTNSISPVLGKIKESIKPIVMCVFTRDCTNWDNLLGYCDEVLIWPCSIKELIYRVDKAARFHIATTHQHSRKNEELLRRFARFNIIGESAKFIKFISLVEKVAKNDETVFIGGETGTGKELAGRAIHYLSKRNSKPFIPINCGAIPDSLFENELFGHVSGAYTDARNTQPGLIERANGGTLFLDEIDSLSTKGQTVLLRFLQDRLYMPLGGSRFQHADVRIITASNDNLSQLCERKLFRKDLMFRINTMELVSPALRDRGNDIVLLAEYYIRKITSQYKLSRRDMHPAMRDWMERYHWPGNIRELENVISRSVLISEGDYLTLPTSMEMHVDGLNDNAETPILVSLNEAKAHAVNAFEKDYLTRLLKMSYGNITDAAKIAHKERSALGKLIKKHGIDRTVFQ